MEHVYGQPLATEMVVSALQNHLAKKHPVKPLVLSFHGDPGTGKTYVSRKILKHMFKKGIKTEYVHFFRGSIDFPLHNEVHKYKVTFFIIIL